MIILQLATTLHGGAGIGLWRYHQALVAAGIDSRILIAQPPASPYAGLDTFIWRKRSIPQRVLMRLGWDTRVETRLRRQIACLDRATPQPPNYELFSLPFSDYCPEDHPWIAQADLINLHWVAGALDWPRFFRRVRKPVMLTLHDQQPYLGGFHYSLDAANNPHLAQLEDDLRTIKQNALQGHRLGVIANSEWNAREARASGFFASETPVDTVYYPLDTTLYAPRSKPAVQAAFALPSEAVVIGFACDSLQNPRKGFDDLLTALERLPDRARSLVTLLSFGREPSPELRSRVSFTWVHLGFLDSDATKAAAYSAMDIFVIPSRAEAFGQTAIEALACGTCVIGSDVGGIREALDDGLAGFLVPACDIPALTRGLASLIENPAQRARYAASGRDLVVERHSPSTLAERYRTACQHLLNSARL